MLQVPLPAVIEEQCFSRSQPFVPTLGILKIISVFIFGYTCHQNIFTIHNELVCRAILLLLAGDSRLRPWVSSCKARVLCGCSAIF